MLTLDRPDRLNAFTAESYRRLTTALAEAPEDGVGAIVLTGAGRAFCAGADLDEVQRPGGGEELDEAFGPMLDAFVRCELPLIAAVNGVAVGLGMTLLLHCDLILVDEAARLRAPFRTRRRTTCALRPLCPATLFTTTRK